MDNPYCFGNYSDCACNQCPAVIGCVKRLIEKNKEDARRKNLVVSDFIEDFIGEDNG